jgi:hypothetical protein
VKKWVLYCDVSRTFSHVLYQNRTTSPAFITGPVNQILVSQMDRCQVCRIQEHKNLSYMGMRSAIIHAYFFTFTISTMMRFVQQ